MGNTEKGKYSNTDCADRRTEEAGSHSRLMIQRCQLYSGITVMSLLMWRSWKISNQNVTQTSQSGQMDLKELKKKKKTESFLTTARVIACFKF